jgi:hypothetical protein
MLVDEDPAVRVSPQVWKAAVENPEIAPEVVTFLVNRGTDTRIADEVFLAAIADPDQAVELLALLHKQNGDFDFPQALFHAAIKNWKSGFEILQWSREMQYYFKYDIMSAVELAVQNVGCGIEVLDYLLSNHRPPRSMPVSIWAGAAANLGCGNILIKRLLEYCDKQVDYTDKSVLKAAADNLNWSKQIFMAFSNIPLLSDAPTRIPQEAILSLVNNWKSGADTMSLLKNSPRWSLAITDALLQMIAQNTPDTGGALAVLLEDVDEFDFPELPDAVSPFWLVRSLKAIEFLVTKCKRSSIPQELVRKITGGWGYDAIRKIIGGTEITQEAFHTSATNLLNDGSITRILRLWNSELVVTDDMLQKAVGNNFDLTKTILDMGQGVSSKTLEVAVKQDNTRILKLLLDTVGGTKIADSVLNTAIFNGSPRIVRILLQHGLEDPISEGQLCKAARKDANLEIMQMLLAHRRGETPSKIDIPQSVLDEAVEESCVSMLELLLDNNVAKPFTENTWAKAVEQKNMEIVRILLKHDPNFEVTDHILKCAVKSARVEALKLLLAHYPQIKISQRTMERAAKCKTVEILRLLAGHIQDKESFTITERFVERAAANDNSEVVTFILQQWPDIHITEDAFEGAVKNIDSKVLDLFLEKFPGLSISTRHLVAAASHSSPDRFRKVLELAKERSILPTEEVLGVIIARAGPSLEDVKLVLEANKDCLTESTLQSAFRLDVTDVEAFKFLFQQRQWPLGFIQSEFRTLMRQRPPVAKIKFLLEQQVYDIKVSSTMFVHAADHFDEFAAQALLESTRAKDCALSPDILDTILKGTVAWSSNLPESTRSPWTYTKLDTNVYQKVKVLLDFREVDVTLKNVVQAQSLKGIGRKIIQLFLDSPDKAMMTEDVRKYAASLVVTKDLTFTIKPKAPPALLSADSEDPQEEHTQVSVRSPSIYSDDDSDSVSSYSSSLDRDAHSLDTLSSDSEKRSREVDRPLTYHSLPFQSVKSGVGAGAGAGAAGAEPTWTTVYEVKQQVVPVAGGGFAEWGVCGGLVLQGNDS